MHAQPSLFKKPLSHRARCFDDALKIALLPCTLRVLSCGLVSQIEAELSNGFSSCGRHLLVEIRRACQRLQPVLLKLGCEVSRTALDRSCASGCELPVGTSPNGVGDPDQVGKCVRMLDLLRD